MLLATGHVHTKRVDMYLIGLLRSPEAIFVKLFVHCLGTWCALTRARGSARVGVLGHVGADMCAIPPNPIGIVGMLACVNARPDR